ncbi:MAG: 2-oxo acid dehydrogenase subunit E2 [Bacteroidia bacterium]|nr:2-oxo acid dehydrogenase subunit E2 [Bacteroidia bacterium]
MADFEMLLPSMGEGFTDATITKWLVREGDSVNEDTPIVEVATDKVDSEIPSPKQGVVQKLLFNEGDVVQIGTPILILKTNVAGENLNKQVILTEVNEISTVATPDFKQENQITENEIVKTSGKAFLSPLVRQIMKEHLITENDIKNLKGSGLEGRITKTDIENFINIKSQIQKVVVVNDVKPQLIEEPIKSEVAISTGEVEVVEMDRMRKIIAEHMVRSVHTSPHVTSFIEADVTRIVEWRNKLKEEFQNKHGEKLTFMPVFIEATAMAIKDFPLINVSVDGTKILIKKNINIGIATALPSWNLIVPVIHNADQKNLIGLSKSVNDLANRARQNKLLPDEIKGGTFTITNLGSFGTYTGTPIINQPEAAILAIGTINKKPAVIETPAGDAIAIRQITMLSVTFDHRIVDGALAGAFLKRTAEYLENFDILRKF